MATRPSYFTKFNQQFGEHVLSNLSYFSSHIKRVVRIYVCYFFFMFNLMCFSFLLKVESTLSENGSLLVACDTGNEFTVIAGGASCLDSPTTPLFPSSSIRHSACNYNIPSTYLRNKINILMTLDWRQVKIYGDLSSK